MFSEEMKQVFFIDWEEKQELYLLEEYNDHLLIENRKLLDIDEVLLDGGMEGLDYSTQIEKIDNVVFGINALNRYIESLKSELNEKIDEPLYYGFTNHATEYLSLIKLENYSTDNLIGAEAIHFNVPASGYGEIKKSDVERIKLVMEDFIGVTSLISSKNNSKLTYVPEEFSLFTDPFKEEYNRAKEEHDKNKEENDKNKEENDKNKDDIKFDGSQIDYLRYIEKLAVCGEFNNSIDKPFFEIMSVIGDATIVIPLIDAFLGVDIITGEDLSDLERVIKVSYAIIDTLAWVKGIKGIGKMAKKDALAYAGKTYAANMLSNAAANVAGQAGENMGMPLPLILLTSVAAGSVTSVGISKYVFTDSAGNVLLTADKNIVDDLAEHLDEVDGTIDDWIKGPKGGVGGKGGSKTLKVDELVTRDSKFLDAEGKIDWEKWAPNGGRVPGTIKEGQTLPAGTIIDRYGNKYGKYTSPVGVPYEQRALPYIENPNAYHKYKVVKPIDNVTISEIAAAFEQPGGGIQYELPSNIKQLLKDGYIKEID